MKHTAEQNIPVLTEILKHGDAGMNRHFDTHGFENTTHEAGIPADNIEQLVSELLDEMLPEFKQKLIERLQERIKT